MTGPVYAAAWKDRKRRLVVFRTVQIMGIPVIIGAAYECSKWGRSALIAVPVWFFVALRHIADRAPNMVYESWNQLQAFEAEKAKSNRYPHPGFEMAIEGSLSGRRCCSRL
jgi:hypothetical protein